MNCGRAARLESSLLSDIQSPRRNNMYTMHTHSQNPYQYGKTCISNDDKTYDPLVAHIKARIKAV